MDIRAIRLKEAMERKGISQTELAKIVGISKGSLSSYLSGRFFPRQNVLHKIALTLDVPPSFLMGFDTQPTYTDEELYNKIDNLYPLQQKPIPLLGEIACGDPITANEEHEEYININTEIQADYALKTKGDSMTNARIHDGDIAFIKQQPTVENGQIAAVLIDGEATLKRVYHYPLEQKLVLQAENPKFPPMVFTGSELKEITILGKVVGFQSTIK